jgi:phosphoserine phosphatase RsbX
MEKVKTRLIEVGSASLTLPGESVSGDLHLVKAIDHEVLVAVVDGVGHGQEAAEASKIAIRSLEEAAVDSLIGLVQRSHDALRFTRGVVMSLASFNAVDGTMTWLGVGNVEGILLHRAAHVVPAQEGLLLRGGVVGDRLPRLAASIIQVSEGDLLIFATDGIEPGFADNVNLNRSPQQIADHILAEHRKGTDDALVLVARYINGQGSNSFR